MNHITGILIITLLSVSVFTMFDYASALDCRTNVMSFIHVRNALLCHADSIDNHESRITVLEGSSGGESTDCDNVGTGTFIHVSGSNCDAKALQGSGDISITNTSNTIIIDYNGTGSGETTVCDNLGSGVPIHKVGSNCSAFSLIAGNDITITNTTNDYTIASTATEDDTACANVGSFTEVYKDGECNFRTINCDLEISCTQNTNDVNIDVDTIGQQQIFVHQTVTKSNLPNTYTDIWVTLFDMEEMTLLHPNNVTYFYISMQYDFVGAGNDQCRWVNTANNTQVLHESTTFTGDQNSYLSGWFTKPSWATSLIYSIEMQCKSSNGTNDPVPKGYVIYAK